MITVDTLMATHPCNDWPRARVERLVPKMDCSSWSAFAASAQASQWRRVSIADLTLTACRHAARLHRATVLIPWVQHVTRVRVAAQRKRYPSAPSEVVALWDRLDAWDGTAESARAIRDDGRRVYRAYADAAYAAAAAAAAVAGRGAAVVAGLAAADAAAADADAKIRTELLLDLCARIDAAEVAP